MATEQPQMTLDPVVTLTAIARETERIGLVATSSTTFNEPYNLARQFKALDVVSHGRAGWNAVTTSDPAAAANYGQAVAERPERYGRAHEMLQVVEALWGSWGQDAWLKDKASGRFVDVSKVQPVNLQGQHVASRGPLPHSALGAGAAGRLLRRGRAVRPDHRGAAREWCHRGRLHHRGCPGAA